MKKVIGLCLVILVAFSSFTVLSHTASSKNTKTNCFRLYNGSFAAVGSDGWWYIISCTYNPMTHVVSPFTAVDSLTHSNQTVVSSSFDDAFFGTQLELTNFHIKLSVGGNDVLYSNSDLFIEMH